MRTALAITIKLLKHFEGCKLKAYKDIVGIWTIGYGETLNVVEGMVWTQEKADSELSKRALYFLTIALKKCPQLFLEPPERVAACVSLAYNIGLGAFGASSVKRYTMRQEFERAAVSILLWNKAGGRVVNGLTIRRKLEKIQYEFTE
jgi:lysozyme